MLCEAWSLLQQQQVMTAGTSPTPLLILPPVPQSLPPPWAESPAFRRSPGQCSSCSISSQLYSPGSPSSRAIYFQSTSSRGSFPSPAIASQPMLCLLALLRTLRPHSWPHSCPSQSPGLNTANPFYPADPLRSAGSSRPACGYGSNSQSPTSMGKGVWDWQ